VIENSNEYLAETKRAMQEQASNGVDAVPHIVFEGRKRDITLTGAKEVDEYVKALELIFKESM
jgi:predicted DsbA family dithiol-disulfide isomerase